MYGVVINCDTAATISGDSPLFTFGENQKNTATTEKTIDFFSLLWYNVENIFFNTDSEVFHA